MPEFGKKTKAPGGKRERDGAERLCLARQSGTSHRLARLGAAPPHLCCIPASVWATGHGLLCNRASPCSVLPVSLPRAEPSWQHTRPGRGTTQRFPAPRPLTFTGQRPLAPRPPSRGVSALLRALFSTHDPLAPVLSFCYPVIAMGPSRPLPSRGADSGPCSSQNARPLGIFYPKTNSLNCSLRGVIAPLCSCWSGKETGTGLETCPCEIRVYLAWAIKDHLV